MVTGNKEFIQLTNGYTQFWNHCIRKKGYSGTAIFTKYKPISITEGIGMDKHDQEGRAITMEFHDFYLVATYIPNASRGLVRLGYRVN